MRLFWKLFCSMVLITALACALGGYALIDAQFRSSFNSEVSSLYEENDLLRYALAQELKFNPGYPPGPGGRRWEHQHHHRTGQGVLPPQRGRR